MHRLLPVAAALVLVACGPSPGGGCSAAGFLCADKSNAMECQAGTWVELPCRGPGGCALANNTVTCDMAGDQEGDACASTALNSGLCAPDGKATLECRSDAMTGALKLVKTLSCSSCSATGTEILCNP